MKRRVTEVAREIDSRLRISEQAAEWAAHHYTSRWDNAAVLQLDDVSGIPFLKDILGVELYQLRARVRARTGDLFTATCPAMPDYERYNTHTLGLGAPEFVHAPCISLPIEVSMACREPAPVGQLARFASKAGGLVLHPYMGIEAVWELARDLSARADVPIAVKAPPPSVTWLANDKCELTRVITDLLGAELLVPSRIGTNAEKLAGYLKELAVDHPQVALKMGRCASAMGNGLFDSQDVLAQSHAELTSVVTEFLGSKEWQPGEQVLAVVWEEASSSPSSQLWIPPRGAGEPYIDGLYEQLLVGPEKMFLGSIPSSLSQDINDQMADVSLKVGAVFQELGYVGRCSFDFIVSDAGLRFTECNGRWGGTSTPMHLMDRLFPKGRPAYRARDYVCTDLKGRTFGDLERAIGDELYNANTGQGRYVLYNVGCLPQYGKFDVISIGESVEQASAILEEEFPKLLERL